MKRILILFGGLIVVGAGIAALVMGFFQGNEDAGKVNITVTAEDSAERQVVFQNGAQEGDEAVYTQHAAQLTLGRLGKEQPTVDEQGKVIYRDGDSITFTLVAADSVTQPFKIFHRVVDAAGTTVLTSDPVEMNQGANSFCCIELPENAGAYAIKFYLEDETQFAARYFVKR